METCGSRARAAKRTFHIQHANEMLRPSAG
jgi:hypothetical protein